MKKTLLTLTPLTLLFAASCKKDDSGSGAAATGGSAYLTTGKWLITKSSSVVEYPSPIGNQNVDLWALIPACQKDNIYVFNTNGTVTTDEGAMKCNATDPQVKTGGSWALASGNTQFLINDPGATGLSITATVLTLDNTTLKIRYITNYGGMNSTTTTTYTKQ